MRFVSPPYILLGLLMGLIVGAVTFLEFNRVRDHGDGDGDLGDLSARHYALGLLSVLVLYAVGQLLLTGQVNWHHDTFHATWSLSHIGGVLLDLLPGGHISDAVAGQPWNWGPSWADELVGVLIVLAFAGALYLGWDAYE